MSLNSAFFGVSLNICTRAMNLESVYNLMHWNVISCI